MPYDDPDVEDPQELVGIELPGDESVTREMAGAFADEFAQLGLERGQRQSAADERQVADRVAEPLAVAAERLGDGDRADVGAGEISHDCLARSSATVSSSARRVPGLGTRSPPGGRAADLPHSAAP